jgi:DNA repair protein SbcC/Rad50
MLGIESLTRTVEEIDRDRKAIQDRLFGVQQDLLAADGSKRSDAIRRELSEMARTKTEVQSELDSLQEALATQQREVSSAMARRDALGDLEERYSKLLTERVAVRKELEGARSNAHRAGERIRELETKQNEIIALAPDHGSYEELIRRKELLDSQAQGFERWRMLSNQLSEAEIRLTKAKQELEERKRAVEACSDSSKRLETVEENIAKAMEERDSLRERSRLLEADIRRLTVESVERTKKLEEVRRLGPESECPTCERKLCEQHSFLVAKLQKELSDLASQVQGGRVELAKTKQELDLRLQRLEALDRRRKEMRLKCDEELRAQESLRASQDKVSSAELELGRLSEALAALEVQDYSEDEHARVKMRIQELRPRWERYRALSIGQEALSRWQEEVRSWESRTSELEERGRAIEARIEALGYKEGERKQAQSALDILLEKKERLAGQVAQTDKRLERVKAEEKAKASALEELERREKAAEDLTRQLEEQSALSRAMRDFRESMMARVVPTLSELSSHLFEELTDGKYPGMELDPDYEISIFDRGEKYAISRFSGGEADLANLCLRLAISKVIAERAGNSLNFLILDEIFGSQDQGRKRNIMEAFGQLSKQFSQILLITHIEDVKDLVGGAVVVQENEDGSSSVSVVS